jgi:hypothetical protein
MLLNSIKLSLATEHVANFLREQLPYKPAQRWEF